MFKRPTELYVQHNIMSQVRWPGFSYGTRPPRQTAKTGITYTAGTQKWGLCTSNPTLET